VTIIANNVFSPTFLSAKTKTNQLTHLAHFPRPAAVPVGLNDGGTSREHIKIKKKKRKRKRKERKPHTAMLQQRKRHLL
jgi:hypothetical protein